MKTSSKAGQGRRTSPPEPSQNPRGPLLAGLSLNMTSSRDARGTKSSIPKEDAPNHKPARGAGRVSISGTIRHLSSKHHPPLASPFLGPNPVFEIKPQGLGLRASPCRRPDSGQARTHPVMSACLWSFGFLSARGMVPRLRAGAKTKVPQRCTRLRRLSRRHAHGFHRRLPGRRWIVWCRPRR